MNLRERFFRATLVHIVLITIVSTILGIIYGALAISSDTVWISPLHFLRLDKIWAPLGWWDTSLTLAAMFFQFVSSPILIFLLSKLFKMKGNIALAYLGSFAGFTLNLLLFIGFVIPVVSGASNPVTVVGIFLCPIGAVLGYRARL